jgi:hypothetical protein
MWQINRVTELPSVPAWAVALVVGAAAPACVRLFADAVERRAKKRTALLIAEVDRAILGTAAAEDRAPEDAGPSAG